jgi:HK97 family phage major capsid protein
MLHLMALLMANPLAFKNIFNDVRDEKIETLQDRLLELNDQMILIRNIADGEKRDLNQDENTQLDSIFNEFDRIEADIRRRDEINAKTALLNTPQGRETEAQDPQPQNKSGARPAQAQDGKPRNTPRIQVIDNERGKWGWNNFGSFAAAVKDSRNGSPDARLFNTPSTYSSESNGADGGFLVPTDFRNTIMQKVMGEESLLVRTDKMTSTGNTLTMPKDEGTPWGSSGVQVYWGSEGQQLTQSKVNVGELTSKLNKLTALVPVTDELLEDSAALEGYLNRRVPEKFDFKINDAIITGNGVGKMLGILNAPCTVIVPKETTQAADTLLYANIVKMWSRMYSKCRRNAVWLINQDLEQQLMQLMMEGNNSSFPAYLPATGLSGSPFATLMGRPVIPVESCSALGDVGDIILADLSQYLTLTKTVGIRSDVSMHLLFDYDMAAFRFIMRIGGQPWWEAPIDRKNGSNTLGCFVSLAERA